MKNKKYRLIKKYPGSPELGTIIYINDDKCYCDKSGGLLGEKDIVLNYPEFWGEIVEKDYEILTVIGNNGHPIPKTIVKQQKLGENGTVPPYRNPEFYVLINSLEKHCL